jgi:2-polyprenyl-3-methyl-5-hydroxy-6-metoxy-1,4-benzoquinol methylase
MTSMFLCVLCGSRKSRPFFKTRDVRFRRCGECGLVQMSPRPKTIGEGEDYAGFDLDAYRSFMIEFRVPQYERDTALIKAHRRGGRLLDAGCGTGEFLDVAEKNGFSSLGVEPSAKASAIAGARHRVIRGEFQDAVLPERSFDVITLWSVLEHVLDPAAVLRRVRALLKEDGVVALRVPDVRGLLPKLALGLYRVTLGRATVPLRVLYQLDWHYKHFTGFDRGTIVKLMNAHAFEILEFRRENSFERRGLPLRMEYLPIRWRATRALARISLGAVLPLAKVLRGEDEVVLVARKKNEALHG